MKRKMALYGSVAIGSLLMMLLRVCDKANALSVLFVVSGMTALMYGLRHISNAKELSIMALAVSATYIVRFYGYTGEAITDVILGFFIGLIMFFLMTIEHLLKKFKDQFWYIFIFPFLYLLFMYFTEVVKINMPFRLDPYFSCIPVLCQITSVLGIYFLDFLLAFTASVIVFVIDHLKMKKWILPSVTYITVLLSVFVFGIWHMNKMNRDEANKNDTVRVAYATGPYSGNFTEAKYASFTLDETINSFTDKVSDAANDKAEILMFSEEAYCVKDTEESTFINKAKEMALLYNMHILLAYEVKDTDNSENGKSTNKLSWISNKGEILYDYAKHCIIPFIETAEYVRGEKSIESFEIEVHGKSLEVATAICYDSDFDIFMSHMGKNIDLLLLPTWDWDVVAEEHFSVARLRAISSETTIIRSVYDGWSAVIDEAGNVLKRDNTNDTGYDAVLIYDVPVK